ncbi:hypothetical protein EMIT0324P_20749 [Pseudomonas chlororaphis]
MEGRAAARQELSDKAQGHTAGEGEDRAEDDKPRQWLDGFFHGGSGNAGGMGGLCSARPGPGARPSVFGGFPLEWSKRPGDFWCK